MKIIFKSQLFKISIEKKGFQGRKPEFFSRYADIWRHAANLITYLSFQLSHKKDQMI